jgi:hypothetical protein
MADISIVEMCGKIVIEEKIENFNANYYKELLLNQ